MVRRRITKRKKSSRFPERVQRQTPLTSGCASTSANDINNQSLQNQNQNQYSTYEHPYATRSKTLRTAQSSINVDGNERSPMKRRQSDSSIVFLGTYRKDPLVVVLAENNEGRCIEFVEKPEAMIRLKTERMDCQNSED